VDGLMVCVMLQADFQEKSSSSVSFLEIAADGNQPYTDRETVVPPSRVHIPAVWPVHPAVCVSLARAYRRLLHGRYACFAVSKYLKVVVGR
jgi:hypothetical protein